MKTLMEEYKTDKYTCKRCKNKDMIPNREGEYIRGFYCKICGEVNYPTNNKILTKKIDKIY